VQCDRIIHSSFKVGFEAEQARPTRRVRAAAGRDDGRSAAFARECRTSRGCHRQQQLIEAVPAQSESRLRKAARFLATSDANRHAPNLCRPRICELCSDA
jgi:hypothetical protein